MELWFAVPSSDICQGLSACVLDSAVPLKNPSMCMKICMSVSPTSCKLSHASLLGVQVCIDSRKVQSRRYSLAKTDRGPWATSIALQATSAMAYSMSIGAALGSRAAPPAIRCGKKSYDKYWVEGVVRVQGFKLA